MSQLIRRLSPVTLFMLSLNGIIGSGWLFAPLYAAKIAGPAALFSWTIGGLAAMLIAFTFAELSTLFPVAGGTAHLPQITHGPLVSFLLSWIGWLTSLMLSPIEVQAVLQYASLYFPSLMRQIDGSPTLTLYGYLWAAILMLTLCLINIMSFRSLIRFNFILFVFKFLVILLTIFALLFVRFEPTNFSGMTESVMSVEGWKTIFSAIATGGVMLAFNGFKSGVELAGESKRLALAIPLSTAGSVIACLLLYLGLQVCFIGAIDPKSITSGGWASLNSVGDIGPFLGLATALGLTWLLHMLYANAVISPLGAGLIYVTSTARILYAMSKMGYVPAFISKLNQQRLPVWAIVVNFFLGMLIFLPFPGWQAMVNFLISAIVITYAMGPLGLIALRFSLAEKERPFKLPWANMLCLLAFYCCNLFSYWTGWQTISKLAITLLLGMSMFLLAYYRRKINISRQEILSGLWFIYYLIGLIVLSYLGSFDGLGIIPFGWDFLVMGVFTIIIYWLALINRFPVENEISSLVTTTKSLYA